MTAAAPPRPTPSSEISPNFWIAAARTLWLQRAVVLFALLLIAATWRLWTPQTVYPQAPLFAVLRGLPSAVQWFILAGQLAALAGAAILPADTPGGRRTLVGFALFTTLAALCDQHRLQPWAYQFVVLSVVLANCGPRRAVQLLRLLTVSIYFFSALSKLDYEFFHTVGQQMVSALAAHVGAHADQWRPETRLALVALLPVGELLVALGLIWGRSRRAALVGSIAMHVLLLLAVGPWGMQHKPGVLLWNLFFIVQNLLLFGGVNAEAADAAQEAPRRTAGAWFAQGLVAAVVLLPLLEPLGKFDHWLAWGLYAPKAGRVVVHVHRAAVERLPESARAHLQEESSESPWLRLRIDDWSLAALQAPIYPQSRFQLGVAEAVGRRIGVNHWITATLLSDADRWNGAREATTLSGLPAIDAAGKRFWFNVHPRPCP